jgi:hypothetical protein
MANNITRTMNVYKIQAFDIAEDGGRMGVEVIAQCECVDASLTKSKARAALANAAGNPMPRGCTVKWDVVGRITYAMPLEDFIAAATVLETE